MFPIPIWFDAIPQAHGLGSVLFGDLIVGLGACIAGAAIGYLVLLTLTIYRVDFGSAETSGRADGRAPGLAETA